MNQPTSLHDNVRGGQTLRKAAGGSKSSERMRASRILEKERWPLLSQRPPSCGSSWIKAMPPPVRISEGRADGILSCSEPPTPARACKPGGVEKQQGGQLRDHPSGLKPQQHGPGEPGPFSRASLASV